MSPDDAPDAATRLGIMLQLADNIAQLAWVADGRGTIEWYNRRFYEYTALTAGEVIGGGQPDLQHPDHAERVRANFRAAIAQGTEWSDTFPLRAADGSYRWFLSRAMPVRDATGTVTNWFGTNTDVTEEREAAERLRASERASQRLAAIVNSSDDAIIGKDLDGTITNWNHGAERIYGYTAAEIIGRPVGLLIPDDLLAAEDALSRRIHAGETVPTYDTVRRHKDGTLIPLSITVSPILDRDGTVIGASKIARDISERVRVEARLRESEDALRRLAAELSEADVRKDEFLATLAHELRNPLAPIRNGLAIMRLAGSDAAVVERSHAMMERQLDQLVRLVDELMDVSRISRGTIVLQRAPVRLADVLAQAVETSRPLLEASAHTLVLDVPPDELRVDGDAVRLSQVFSNLLNNAARYTDRGGRITLALAEVAGQAEVRVRDTGIGIPPAMLRRVFDMFTQVDRSLERSVSGLGIGLTLVQRLVQMHGGSVEARSEGVGHGSEFVVRLPLVRMTPADAPVRAAGAVVTPLRILVCDDNADVLQSMSMLLSLLGHEVRAARDGIEAVAVAEAFRPDVLFLDIGMPRRNGYEVCRELRRASWGASAYIVAVTGWGQDDDRTLSADAGFDQHLVKPIDQAVLQDVLARSVAARR